MSEATGSRASGRFATPTSSGPGRPADQPAPRRSQGAWPRPGCLPPSLPGMPFAGNGGRRKTGGRENGGAGNGGAGDEGRAFAMTGAFISRLSAQDLQILRREAGPIRGHSAKVLVLERAGRRALPTLSDLRAAIAG